jgi:hypothetical protein
MCGYSSVSPQIESLVNPNVVMRGNAERYMNSPMVLRPDAPPIMSELSLPALSEQQEYYKNFYFEGLFVDSPATDRRTTTVPADTTVLHITGWAFDPYTRQSIKNLYVRGKNDTLIEITNINIRRDYFPQWWVDNRGDDGKVTAEVGFDFSIPIDMLESRNEVTFVREGSLGEELPTVTFKLISARE